MPTSFVVGKINGDLGDLYGFNVTVGGGPYTIGSGPTVTLINAGSVVDFKVYQPIPVAYQPNRPPLRVEWANFSFGGTFDERVPTPSNVTLFGGAVEIGWFVNSSLLYLNVSTK